MSLRYLFSKQFQVVIKKLEEEGFEVKESGRVYEVLESELTSFLDDLLKGYCCDKEMGDILNNVISECRLRPVRTREYIYYQRVDSAILECS